MKSTGLLKDLKKGNSNSDVRQKGRSGQTLSIRSHGGGGKERERKKLPGKQVINMINTSVYHVAKFTLTISSLYLTSLNKTIFNSYAVKKTGNPTAENYSIWISASTVRDGAGSTFL